MHATRGYPTVTRFVEEYPWVGVKKCTSGVVGQKQWEIGDKGKNTEGTIIYLLM